jgi:hypothetical protein
MGPGAQVSRALADDGDVGLEHVPGGQKSTVDSHRLEVATPRLARGDGPGQAAGEGGEQAGEAGGQGAAVGHHVRDLGRRAVKEDPGQDRRQRRVQVRGDHRHAGQVLRALHHRAGGGVLLVDGEADRLQWTVPGLDDVAGPGETLTRQAVRQRHHEGETTGAQAQVERGRVQQHPVTGVRLADQIRVREGCQLPVVRFDGDLDRAAPGPEPAPHQALLPMDHIIHSKGRAMR